MKIVTPSFEWFFGLHVAVVVGLIMFMRIKRLATWKHRKLLQRGLGIGWVVLIVASIWSAWGDTGEQNPHEEAASQPPYFRCLYYGFPDGEVLPAKSKSGSATSAADTNTTLHDDAPGCLTDFEDLIKHSSPQMLVFIGRADRRELAREKLQKYGSNETLAYRRARSVKDQEAGDWKGRSVFIASGPAYADGVNDPRLLERDRSVEIRAYWDPAPAESSSGTGNLFNVDRKLVLLGAIVALSAYLATVGIFLRQRIVDLKRLAREHDPANVDPSHPELIPIEERRVKEFAEDRFRTTQYLRLLILADIPLILSAVLLFFHTYDSWHSLRGSMQLLTMGVAAVLIFHASQWIESAVSWWRK